MDNKLVQVSKRLQENINFTIRSDEISIEKSTEVISNKFYSLKIIDNQKTIDVDFTQSIGSTFALHNTDGQAHSNIVSSINSNISYINNQLSNKVDKIDGKTLSTNDLTNLLKSNYDSAYTNSHTHNNKILLDNLISSGNGNYYLTNDGTYKPINASMIINTLGATSSNHTLEANKITTASFSGTPTITLPSISDSTKETTIILDFTTTNSSYPTINTTGITLKKKDGKSLTYSILSGVRNRLIFTTIDSGTSWEVKHELFGGVETTFVQNALTTNGTLGGSNQAVYASNEYLSYLAYMASDNNSSTSWGTAAGVTSANYIRYNPVPVKATSFDFTNTSGGGYTPAAGTIYGSNDNSNYTVLTSFTNSNGTSLATWNIPIPANAQGFYNYYKIYIASVTSGNQIWLAQISMNGTYIITS